MQGSNLKIKLEELIKLETRSRKKTLSLKIEVGKAATKAKEENSDEFHSLLSRPRYKSRLNEVLAITRAIDKGFSEEVGSTALQKFGEALQSKDDKKKARVTELAENKQFKAGGKKYKLNEKTAPLAISYVRGKRKVKQLSKSIKSSIRGTDFKNPEEGLKVTFSIMQELQRAMKKIVSL